MAVSRVTNQRVARPGASPAREAHMLHQRVRLGAGRRFDRSFQDGAQLPGCEAMDSPVGSKRVDGPARGAHDSEEWGLGAVA